MAGDKVDDGSLEPQLRQRVTSPRSEKRRKHRRFSSRIHRVHPAEPNSSKKRLQCDVNVPRAWRSLASLRSANPGRGCARLAPPAWLKVMACSQGVRLKESCGDKAGKEVVVPRGDFALEAEAVLAAVATLTALFILVLQKSMKRGIEPRG